jgi:uncharacterized protein (TIGR03000 family)
MRKRLVLPAVTAGVLAVWLAGPGSAHAGLFRGPYDFSLGLYRSGQGWSYAEAYGYDLPVINARPASIFYYPFGWPLFTHYPYYNFINPAYVGYHPSPAAMKAMARDVALPPVNTLDGAAVIDIKVPCYADLWVEGVPTQQLGTDRLFTSPPLEKGCTYVYVLRARWVENGRFVEQEQPITVHAGDHLQVVFPRP